MVGRRAKPAAEQGSWRENVNLPWSNKGWYGRESRANRDQELDRLIQTEGGGKINPLGWYEDRPGYATNPARHNPYANLYLVVVGAWTGWILLVLMDWAVGAWFVAGFFWFAAIWIAAFSAIRVPAWHRARRVAKAYLAEHGGEMPYELRTWG